MSLRYPFSAIAGQDELLQALLLGSAVALGAIIARQRDPAAPQAPQNDGGPMWLGLSPVVAGAIEIGLYNTTGTILQTWYVLYCFLGHENIDFTTTY